MKNRILYWVICLLVFTSCGDFLEDYSQDLAYAASTSDLEELLIGNCYIKRTAKKTSLSIAGSEKHTFPWLHVMDDDCVERNSLTDAYGGFMPIEGFYHWDKNPFNQNGTPYKDETWSDLYSRIAIANVVIPKVDDMTDDPIEDRNRIKGEALFLRASFYYFLINFYALPYSKTTADTELGVPLKLTEYIEDKYFSRNTVAEVYDAIVEDLQQAIPLLKGVEQTTVYQTNEAAARLFLSRVYLYMEKWEDVIAQCDSVLKMATYSLEDLRSFTMGTSFTRSGSPETIFSQGSYSMDLVMREQYYNEWYTAVLPCPVVSDDLQDSYNENDLRWQAFMLESYKTPGLYRCIKLRDQDVDGYVSDVFLLRMAEVYLNKAEAQAMSGDEAGAKATLNILRENRFVQGQMPTIEDEMITNRDENFINFIRNERRRELCFEGHRWFDLRRYAVSSTHPFTKEILHPHYSRPSASQYSFEGNFRLKKYNEETAYVLPIPDYAISYNNGSLVQNEIREERKINN
ncbi:MULTISPECIES: RagB/SusD family nutrient uptake outer membrane protein [Butyricimonas]|uniref:RagB/SusD family nutrient uptake outer membrane protein n=1 Tax=Butyricimonas TaxID=574697 RepID=UPI0007FB1FB4|nr:MULTISPECIES: RagB/SusD family nutrient uptake outer membrane protein [Butyricimonas]